MYQSQYYPTYFYPQNSTTPLQTTQSQYQPEQQKEHFGFISVSNEQQARNWPIAPGNSLTFKDESSPYIYTKTMGLSQFDVPIFEKYRLTKEEDPSLIKDSQINEDFKNTVSSLEAELNKVQDGYKSLRKEFDEMKNWMRQPFMSKSSTEDE